MKRIAYLVPSNSTTAQAAVELAKRGYGFLECITPQEIIDSIDNDTYGVLPLQDCFDASNSFSLDALINTDRPVFLAKKHMLVPDFRIFMQKGVGYHDITRIKTPVHAYELCRNTLHNIMPHAKVEFVSSTDRAIEELDSHTCAIAGFLNNDKELSMALDRVTDLEVEPIAFGFLTLDNTISKDATHTLITIRDDNKLGVIARVAEVLDKYEISVESFRTHKVTKDEIVLLIELNINARVKAFRDAINELDGSKNLLEQQIKQVNEDASFDDRNFINIEAVSENKKKGCIVKILGCY